LTVKRILIVLVLMGRFANLVKPMEKDQVITVFGSKNTSSLDLRLKRKIDLSTSLAV